jgi:hypothetical protein
MRRLTAQSIGNERRLRMRVVLGLLVITAALAVSPTAIAAPASTTFAVRGFEYAFTSTVGQFAGSAVGAADVGAWDTRVIHDPLGSAGTVAITGGTFSMRTKSLSSWASDFVTGQYTGGTISVVDPGANCTNQRYRVVGTLGNVATSTTVGGAGSFDVILTHHRRLLFGSCITYSATVTGGVSFSY